MAVTQFHIARSRPLREFISRPESGGDYNIVWGGIKPQHRPKRPLTSMTIRQVLAWQDSIDPLYMSEASGKYQIMEDTLRGLWREAGMSLDDLFDEAGQDRLGTALLMRRGYGDYLEGGYSVERFANALAKEWASLPVVSGPKKGRSYYGGDGLNKSQVSVKDFLAAVEAAADGPAQPVVDHVPTTPIQTPKSKPWAALWAAIMAFLGKGKT